MRDHSGVYASNNKSEIELNFLADSEGISKIKNNYENSFYINLKLRSILFSSEQAYEIYKLINSLTYGEVRLTEGLFKIDRGYAKFNNGYEEYLIKDENDLNKLADWLKECLIESGYIQEEIDFCKCGREHDKNEFICGCCGDAISNECKCLGCKPVDKCSVCGKEYGSNPMCLHCNAKDRDIVLICNQHAYAPEDNKIVAIEIKENCVLETDIKYLPEYARLLDKFNYEVSTEGCKSGCVKIKTLAKAGLRCD